MADPAYIATKNFESLQRLAQAIPTIAEALGLQPPVLDQWFTDAGYRDMVRLANIVTFIEGIADSLGQVNDQSDRLAMSRLLLERLLPEKTKGQLEQLAGEFGVDLAGAEHKADVVAAIAEQMTGKRIDVIPASEVPEDNTHEIARIAPIESVELPEDAALRISDVEDTEPSE